jgi:N-acetylmuramoyl-L-alanine amidase
VGVVLVAAGAVPDGAAAVVRRATVDPSMQAILSDGERLYVEATPRSGEGLIVFARRLCDTSSAAAKISEANGGVKQLKSGLRYRVPFELLSPELQLQAARALFRSDKAQTDGWKHVPKASEGLWHVARWFTGRGENFAAIRDANRLREDTLDAGQAVVIPARLLLPAFRAQLPAPAPRGTPAPPVVARTAVAAPVAPPPTAPSATPSAPGPSPPSSSAVAPAKPPAAAAPLQPIPVAGAIGGAVALSSAPSLQPGPTPPPAAAPSASAGTDAGSVDEDASAPASTPLDAVVAPPQVAAPPLDATPADGTDLEETNETEAEATEAGGATSADAGPPAPKAASAGPASPPVAVIKPTSMSTGATGLVAAGASSVANALRFEKDAHGDYAIYPLKPGEALYSSVVVRFTGRIYADDVNALAAEIAKRSAIRDVTDIPIGFPVRIPLDLLLPEFLPADHPRRLEYEAGVQASAAYKQRISAAGLEGVTVVLDAGHGGRDVGAMVEGVREATYVYDIAVRVKRLLEEYTRAKVVMTTRDGKEHRLENADVLAASNGHAVLTTPPYPIADSKIGVHLRWYLANSVLRQAAKKTSEADRVVFLSLHADSLHPSLRGAMAYIPDAQGEVTRSPFSGSEYARRREVREQPRSVAGRAEMQRSAGMSRQFADGLIEAFRDVDLAVHPFKPVRDRIVRGRRPWVPAVLKYNAVPTRALLEVCNLNNPQDRTLLQTRAYRQRVAEAVVAALSAYYAPASRGGSPQRAARR